MAARRVRGSSYGQKRPPLTDILKSILERYPDGGQILKEIIQNSDDAGARKIRFVLDTRKEHYGKSSLYHPEYLPEPSPGLRNFQGPALYAQNDALFEEDDWENLMNLMKSNKKDDPLKVGRFGIGFNSVYHITDLPGLVSGGGLAFLDPHETHFGRKEAGQQFSLEQPLLEEFYDQFSPFEDVLDCKISTGYYEGTLFRFPLRNEPSELSSKPYTVEKVRNLFASLRQEAPLILLFLKNVEEICLYETNDVSKETLVFSVKLRDTCRTQVREAKRMFLEKLTQLDPTNGKIEHCLQVTIEEIDYQSRTTLYHDWLIYNCVDPTDSRIRKLYDKLGLLPWVGFATPLTRTLRPTEGRIFCFLPLPPDAKTGFPVHIHGYFGLSDNRRGLKWPGPDCQNDDTAEWNELLLKLVGSYAYATLVEALTHIEMPNENGGLAYQSWPFFENVQTHWKCIIEPMMKILAQKNVLWTPAGGGKWITAQECLLNHMEVATAPVPSHLIDTVLQTLTQASENVVTVPSHMMYIISNLLSRWVRITEVTPACVRALLKKKKQGQWTLANMSREDKLNMLQYILRDSQFYDLEGVALLPKADGTFVEFRSPHHSTDASAKVYVPTSEHSRELLPNFDHQLLDQQIPLNAFQCLSSLTSGTHYSFQLVMLTAPLVETILWNIIPKEWLHGSNCLAWLPESNHHPPLSWLNILWQWLSHRSLTSFEGYPLIPHSSGGKKFIEKLRKPATIIRRHWHLSSMPDAVAAVLRNCQCVVLDSLPGYVTHTSLQTYIAFPNAEGVLGVLQSLERGGCIRSIAQCSPEQKRALRQYITGIAIPNQQQRELLLQLPIFEGTDGRSFLALNNRNGVAPPQFRLPGGLSICEASRVISADDDASRSLLKLLGVSLPSSADFLVSSVFPAISSGFYNPDQVTTLMLWVLKNFYAFQLQFPTFGHPLTILRCIRLENGSLVTPRESFDPRDPLLKELFKGDCTKFPRVEFCDLTLLPVLISLGMKRIPEPDDLLNVARCLPNVARDVAWQRGMALLKILSKHTHMLKSTVRSTGKSLAKSLHDLPWVPYQQTPPETYPSVMPWKSGCSKLYKPSESKSFKHANLVGACGPIAPRIESATVEKALGWDKDPPLPLVLQQLSIACTMAQPQSMNGRQMDYFRNMLREIYQVLSQANVQLYQLSSPDFPGWIWHGNGFAPPGRMAFHSECQLNLKPHLYTLPDDFREFDDLFRRFGVNETFREYELLTVLQMIKESHENVKKPARDVSRDLQLCIDILHWIVKDHLPVSENLRHKVIVPAMTYDNTLKLVHSTEANYCDADWLRGGGSELQITSDYTLIHEKISMGTASLLHVPPISTSLASAEPLGFEQTGPHEPITTRLKNILNEYKEGAGVLKELVQNADDAGATEVKLLVDWRKHDTHKLLSPGMAECQGPALLAYSNSVFTDDDLQNISKLAGATKKEDMEKIGRFGLGFSSVYHFTDVPSFLTREYAVFFDPHTKHLGAQIRNSSRPGIKLDLKVNSTPLKAFPDQFKPYNGIFGCDTSGKNGEFSFDGTLFRFPFRKKAGEISDKTYSKEEMRKLLISFQEVSSNLLLFVQNVKQVSIYELDGSSCDPSTPRMLLKVSREEELAFPGKMKSPTQSFLKDCAEWNRSTIGGHVTAQKAPKRSDIVSIKRTIYQANGNVEHQDSSKWLVNSCMGQQESFKLGSSKEGRTQGLLSCASVAARLTSSGSGALQGETAATDGEAFCFLPLSIPTGLPVHVNGYFAVTSNRRGIWEATTTENFDIGKPLEVRWNEVLMEDALTEAYLQLLVDLAQLKQLRKFQSYGFSIWPDIGVTHSNAWKPLIKSVYRQLATSSAPLVECGPEWLPVKQCVFPDQDLRNLPGSLQILSKFGYKIAELPFFAYEGFREAGCGATIEDRKMTKHTFLRNVFFPRIAEINAKLRNPIICHILDEYLQTRTRYHDLLCNSRCIPCTEDQRNLARPSDLVDPTGKAAPFFSADDKRFPVGDCYRTAERLLALQKLGMVKDDLDWTVICERAESVEFLKQQDMQCARRRVKYLIKYLNENTTLSPAPENLRGRICKAEILPVLGKPQDCALPWKGVECNNKALLSAEELYDEKHKYLVGASRAIIDQSEQQGCGQLSPGTKEFLGFPSRSPNVGDSLVQLKCCASVAHTSLSPLSMTYLQDTLSGIYKELSSLKEVPSLLQLESFPPWIWHGAGFAHPSRMAFSWVGKLDLRPYLFVVPRELQQYRHFFQSTGTKEVFDESHLLEVLQLIQNNHATTAKSSEAVTHDLRLVTDILHWLISDGCPIEEKLQHKVLVPVTTNDSSLKLVPYHEATYCDAAWLRRGGSELSITSDLALIHHHISDKTARLLRVPPISTRLTSAEAFGFEQTGPYEPITIRLKNILDEYKEGAGVLKELVQNADDAGATKVKLLVDWRNHASEKLLSPGMAQCQGPALLVYSNSVFTDDDMRNISKVAGATKKEDTEKIGRFGLGFSSVYHFTDVPSFLTRNYAVFFDPCLCHLGDLVQNISRPGIKLDLKANSRALKAFPDQFLPYDEIFGCHTKAPDGNSSFDFKGTLFRFPLRRSQGEISSKIYEKKDVQELLGSFKSILSTLLLFVQNVDEVSVFELNQDAKTPSTPNMLFTVTKQTIPADSSRFLQDCAKWSKQALDKELLSKATNPPPRQSDVVSITCKIYAKNGSQESEKCATWFVRSCLGEKRSFEIASSKEGRDHGLLSCAGVAAMVRSSNQTTEESYQGIDTVEGEAFSFLPLSIPTGLPVHVNGHLAVTSNRRGIWEATTAERSEDLLPLEARWNETLMEDALAQAYLILLQDMVTLKKQRTLDSYDFYSLWPNPHNLKATTWMPLLKSVYCQIASSSFPFVCSGSEWLLVNECIYPDADLQAIPGSVEILCDLGYKMVDLPPFASQGFREAECGSIIEDHRMTQERFLNDVFFPRISEIPMELRDPVICYVLDQCFLSETPEQWKKQVLYKGLLENHRCIPCSPLQLAYPKDLVDPNGVASRLFVPEDRRFPLGECYRTNERLLMLANVGMAKDLLSWDLLCERAKSVSLLTERTAAKERAVNLLLYLDNQMEALEPISEGIKSELRSLELFPVLAKPTDYTLPWRGANYDHLTLLPASAVYEAKYKFLAGSSKPILNESPKSGCGSLGENVRQLFGFSCCCPTVIETLHQLEEAINCAHGHMSASISKCISAVSKDVYRYLQDRIREEEGPYIMDHLSSMPWILVGDKFCFSSQLAFEWQHNGSPYLFEVPASFKTKFATILQEAGVRKAFEAEEFIKVLFKMQREKGETALTEEELQVARCFLEKLTKNKDITKKEDGRIPVPDHSGVLREAKCLAIDDSPWIRRRDNVKCVNDAVPKALAHQLGSRDIREVTLEDISYPIGVSFGQNEKLTDRLKGILKNYPYDLSILKELVQNADDARATEIHFIFDPRTHSKESVLSDNWKELQGPALCVFNDQPFSERDLEGIQRLGIGSKADDPEKTGQYGIGFNSVYHLTDCPSFISDGDTLCILDPHAAYAPGATLENPGRLIHLDQGVRGDFKDMFPGYLEDEFDLSGGTMFRFPLRKFNTKSLISDQVADIPHLMNTFRSEARDILLFLNHVKKISLSQINDAGQLESIYHVSAALTDDDLQKRADLSAHVKNCKDLETADIEWLGVTYPMTVSDSLRDEEWLVHQCLGSKVPKTPTGLEVPNGKAKGLLPRAGVAAKISEFGKVPPLPSFQSRVAQTFRAFCFLPLPIITGLPVHVNGHFYLDSGRRNLWRDDSDEGFGTRWNCFMKSHVLAQAYVSLIKDAREFIPGMQYQQGEMGYFSKRHIMLEGMKWFNELFPPLKDVATSWKELADAVYDKIAVGDEKTLPYVRKVKATEDTEGSNTPVCHPWKYPCEWLSPSEGFFRDFTTTTDVQYLVLDVGFRMLDCPHRVFEDFKTMTKSVKQLCPENLLEFLKSTRTDIGNLPCLVTQTAIGSAKGVLLLLEYCMGSTSFAENLPGVPLLLTQDVCLKRFEVGTSVYLSSFHDLVPSKPHLFLHKSLVIPLLRHKKELFNVKNVSVVKEFDIPALAELLPVIFPGQLAMCTEFVPWEKMNHAAFDTWLKRLWHFIYKVHKNAQGKRILHPLLAWPVLPTTSNSLAPIALSEAVLDLTHSESWSPSQKRIVEILRKLKCPEADFVFMSNGGVWDIHPVLKSYVAHPNCSQEILKVLEHLMQRSSIDGILTEEDMLKVLAFLQEDIAAIKQHAQCKSVIMKLPFFKSLSGKCVCLARFPGSIYVVPEGLPLEECEVWMTGSDAIFLASCPELRLLYKEILGVDNRSHVECYLAFIFPTFGILQPDTRLKLLEYLRDEIWPRTEEAQKDKLRRTLEHLAFMPDSSGTLRTPSHFFDPNNKVFKVMLKKADFPPKPFKSVSWLWLLREVGLKKDVTKDQFLDFAEKIERDTCDRESQLTKSKVLVSHLFKENTLHELAFLRMLATVKFIPPLKVNSILTNLHTLYACTSREEHPPLVAFRGAVDGQHEYLVWTSAPLLQSWTVPINNVLCDGLGVLKTPSVDQIVTHTRNLAESLSGQTDREMREPRRTMLQAVMVRIYTFLKSKSSCTPTDSLEACTAECRIIGDHLCGVPCILVDDGRVFVQCNQLAFELYEELPPYLYKVPRVYGPFEHLFKRLGAVEEATPMQYAKMLERLKETCKDEEMHAEERSKAKSAVVGLFSTLHDTKERSERRSAQSMSPAQLSSLSVLYLPSQAHKLRKSTDLILDNCPEFTRSIKQVKDDLVDDLTKYRLTFARPEEIMRLLPAHLQPKELRSLVHEDLHPDCEDTRCETHSDGCVVVNRLLDLLFSQEFADGIKRILKYERHSTTLPKDVLAKVNSFQSDLDIACMKVLTTQLVFTESGKIVQKSTRWPEVFSRDMAGKTCLYIKHGEKGEEVNTRICQEVNRLIDDCITKESLLQLILSCEFPREISAKLDKTGVAKDVEANENLPEDQELGSEIPVEFHYLLVQYEDFLFREGEMVGYEKEETGGNAETEPSYVHARIIRRIQSTATRSKPKKDRTKRKQRGESVLLSRYLIDIGSEKIEVDVLDLYKWKRPHEVVESQPEEPLPETRDIVPFEGDSSTPPPSTPPKPNNLEEAKKEVRKALKEIWKLPVDKRKKAIRRLYLRWHPDKNIQQEVLATEVMKFIQQEIDRLNKGGSASASENDFDFGSYFRQWDQRARTQRTSYQNFRRQNPGFSGFYHDSSRSGRSWGHHSRDYTSPDSGMARLWMKQYQTDLRAVNHVLSSREPFHFLVCSLCHEVVEKALKAALYSSSGISSTQLASHDLARLAVDVSGLPGAPNVVTLMTKLCDYYEPTRYPHKHHPARVPADVYTDQQAQEAWQITKRVVSLLENFMGF